MKKYNKNRLRTSCAPAVGRWDVKKMKTEVGAVQPITANSRFRFAPPSAIRGTLADIIPLLCTGGRK